MFGINKTFLTFVLFFFNEIHAFFGWETIFGNPLVKDYRVYWNVPTFMCHKYGIQFEEVSRDFGVIQNSGDEFRGNEVAILYDPGMFPALLKSPNGTLVTRNGGVPQKGNLTEHLELFRKHLIEQIPDESFSGLGIIDFESWRPIFRQNWASLEPYRQLSMRIERQKHPRWDKKSLEKEAVREFEKSGKEFMEETLKAAKFLRPQAKWGYYAYPYCFNLSPGQTSSRCDTKVLAENDNMSWLFGAEDVLLPSVYLRFNLTTNERIGLINGRVKEAMRISRKMRPRTKVLAYFWYKYSDQRDIFLSREDTVKGFREIADQGADGNVIWGSSNDFNSRKKCEKFREYLNDVLGPAILDSKEMANQRVTVDDEKIDDSSKPIEGQEFSQRVESLQVINYSDRKTQLQPSAISVP